MDSALSWLGAKLANGLRWFGSKIADGMGFTISEFEWVFVLATIIGFYFIMAGNRKLGTTITSVSFVSYLILTVVS